MPDLATVGRAHLPETEARPVVVIGKESVGKSSLVAGLTGGALVSANFRGTTIAAERYATGSRVFIDTPGIYRNSDAETTQRAVVALNQDVDVLLVVQGTHIDEDLRELIPLVGGRRGVVVVTHWDRVEQHDRAGEAIQRLQSILGVPVFPCDARALDGRQRIALDRALESPGLFPASPPAFRVGWRVEPRHSVLDGRVSGPMLATLLLVAPAVVAIYVANTVAGLVDPLVGAATGAASGAFASVPSPLREILIGDYGLITMGPLLLVWALPTVLVYSLFLGLYKASGLLDRISVALFPLMRPFGLTGRDLTRVFMGFGCNVPAIISSRSCAGCTRDSTIGAIAFGSACSYQLGATLAVFAAAGQSWLVWPYLGWLTVTTLAYTRITARRDATSALNLLTIEGRVFLARPSLAGIWREARGSIKQFFRTAMPVFLGITVVASLLAWTGVINLLARGIEPAMGMFRLPADAAIPVILASIRKDGILLFDSPDVMQAISPWQLLTGVYLAGVLLPCLVTALTISRERGPGFVAQLLGRQVVAALTFSLVLAWAGWLVAGQGI